MAYLIICTDKKNSIDLRLSTREKHIRYLKKIKKKLILAGPILDKNDEPVGTVLILDFEKLTDVKKFLNDDPYYKVNLFEKVKTTRFKKVL
tara:strand:+ start:333 stop:605 length:273 start_codon:yes stop_codon:yes gene_type:complete